MKHYFVQHGIALSKDIDVTQPLSNQGIEETRAMAKLLAEHTILPSHICHSSKTRASQTAEIFATELAIDAINEINGLNPNDDVQHFRTTHINQRSANTLYVGHLPHLGKLVSLLVANDETANCIQFQNSAVVCIETIDTESSLLWYLTTMMIK